MASNTIILTQPESENVISHEIPNDSSARLNYDVQDIEGLAIGPDGELIISFEDGGQVNITNFESFTEGGNLLYLSDGTLVDATILTSAPLNPMALGNIETAAGDSTTETISKPEAGETTQVTVQDGVNYVCDFDPENAALVEVKDGQMILTFADGSQVVINNYNDVVAGQLPEELTVADAAVVEDEILTEVTDVEDITDGDSESSETVAVQQESSEQTRAEQVANIETASGDNMDALAQQLQEIEPAAGETAGSVGRGYGFNSSPVDVNFAAPDAIGPLGPTALQYNAPQFQDELLLEENEPFDPRPGMNPDALTLDETDLSGGPLVAGGNVNVDFGGDGNGGITPNGTVDVTCDFAGVELTSGGVTVDIVPTVDGYEGTAGGNPVFTFVINPETGEYTYTQVAPFDHGITTDDNEAICLNFGIVATDGDGDQTNTNVQVNVLDDAPVVLSQVPETVDETTADAAATGKVSVNGQFFADAGQDVGATFGGTDTFDSSVALTSNGVPVQVGYNDAQNMYIGTAGTAIVFTAEIDPATGEYEFILCGPLDHPDTTNPDDNISLEFGAFITDFDGDTKEGSFVVNIRDDGPEVQDSAAEIDETDGTGTVTGSVNPDFGFDGAGTVEGTTTLPASLVGLTSDEQPVTVTFDNTTNTYTGATATADIFTLEIDPATGDYTFELLGPLDHPDSTNPDDSLVLDFGVVTTDNDGDSIDTLISITVKDDGPSVGSAQSVVDETDGNVVVNGNVAFDGGFDGVEDFAATGGFSAGGSKAPGPLTSNGEEVVVTFDANTGTYTGATATSTIFTMTVNNDGSYEFELLGTLDHADPDNANDIINLDFTVQVTDNDGDTAENIVRILVKDDVPTIGDSSGDVDETNFDLGPLVYNDVLNTSFGADVATISADGVTGSSVPLTSDGQAVTIGLFGNTYSGTTAGGDVVFTLEVNPATGEYEYTQFLPLDHPDSTNPDDTLTIDFGVQITSVDGDSDTGTITITVADDGPIANDDINGAEEGQKITGDLLVNDELSQDGDDTDQNTVTNVNFEGTDYPIAIGGSTVINGNYGTITVNSDGTYEYVTNNNDPDGTDTFVYTLTDRDGDSDTAQLDIRVTPDGQPVAVDERLAVDETNLTPGPMIFNGDVEVDFGLDGAGTVEPQDSVTPGGSLKDGTLTSNDVPVDINLVGDTYTGTAGAEVIFTLQVNPDGTYIFQLFSHLDHADATDPNDAISLDFAILAIDADGDATAGNINILVYDDAPVAYDDGTTTLDESQTVTGNVTNNDELSEDKPNHVVEVVFDGVTTVIPVGGAAVQIVGDYGVLTISSDGAYSYKANDDNPEGTDTYTYVLEDFDGDQDTAEISFKVNPLNDNPIIVKPEVESVDETDLDDGTVPQKLDGTIEANFFGDGPGTIDPNDSFTTSIGDDITSNGQDITVTSDTNGYTGTRTDGTVVFTVDLQDNGDYEFTLFDVIDHPDATDHNDIVTLSFGVTATDKDGDTASTTLMVNVYDDGPVIENKARPIDESDADVNGELSYTHTLNFDFGEDGPGQIEMNGTFQTKYQVGGNTQQLKSGGEDVTVTNTDTTYTGTTTSGAVVFTLVIDPQTGEYTYTQFQAIDHPDATDHDDVIWLKFGVDIVDYDGDTDDAFIIVDLHDDGPIARDDVNTSTTDTVSGNVTDNDDFGYDGEGCVQSVEFEGTVYLVAETGDTTVEGNFGTLVINSAGDYTYTAKDNVTGGETIHSYNIDNPAGSDNAGDIKNVNTQYNETTKEFTFSVTVEPSAEGFTLAINNGPNPKGHAGEMALFYFDASNPGTPVVTAYNYNGQNTQTSWMDGSPEAGTQTPDQILSSLLNAGAFGSITSTTDGDGNVVYSFSVDASILQEHVPTYGNAAEWTGAEFGEEVGIWLHPVSGLETEYTDGYLSQWDISSQSWFDASYKDTTTITEGGKDNFTYTIKDADGDTSSAELCVKVAPDETPVIVDPETEVVDETNLDNGDLVVSGTIDANFFGDGPGTIDPDGEFTSSVQNLQSCGMDVTVTNDGDSYTGTRADGVVVFTLAIADNGDYTFTQFETLDHPDATDHNDAILLNFGVTATDSDGDIDSTTLSIRVLDDGPTASKDTTAINEVDLAGGSIIRGGQLNIDFGEDGAGTVTTNGDVKTLFVVGGDEETLTSGGEEVIITETANGYVGTVNGTTTFELTIENDGSYTYTQHEPIDHPKENEVGTDDVIWIKFGVTVTDKDGDTADTFVQIDVRDDGPDAEDDCVEFNESQDVLTGNVLDNDEVGADDPADVLQVKFDGQTFDVPADGSDTTIDGEFGALTINKDGDYSYDLYDNAFPTSTAVTPFLVTDNNTGVTMQVSAVANANGVEFSVEIVSGTADLIAFYLDVNGDGGPVFTAGGDEASGMQGTAGFDYGYLIGTSGGNDPDVTQATIQIDGITLDDLENGLVGIRGMSAGSNEEGSYKAIGEIETIQVKDECVEDQFTYVMSDADGDTDEALLKIKAFSDNDIPTVNPAHEVVDETNLDAGNLTDTGTIVADFKGDGPGTIDPNGTFTSSVNNLTSCDKDVTVTNDGDSYTGTRADGVVVFTLTIADNGDYVYTQFDTLDHPDTTDHNDALTLNFGVTATDVDGDQASTILSVKVLDDGPVIYKKARPIDESDADANGEISYTHTLNFDFGEDGAGAITTTDTFQAKYQVGGQDQQLKSGGENVNVTSDNNSYTGTTTSGAVVFTLVINPTSGQYTYTQFQAIDHPDAHNADDVIWLKFGVEITDKDGDTDQAMIIVDLHDDGPVARDDSNSGDTDNIISGNVVFNDNYGYDGAGCVLKVSINGQTVDVPSTGVATITGTHGTLRITAGGSYTYAANDVFGDGTVRDTFTYTLKDADGDTDTANLNIDVTLSPEPNDIPDIFKPALKTVDESNDVNGKLTTIGKVNADFKTDGPGTIDPNDTFTSSVSNLKSCDKSINVTSNGNGYTGTRSDGIVVFTLVVQNNGDYTYTQHEPIDHPNSDNPNDEITLNFGVTATDADGDTASTTVSIRVLDDGPIANDDRITEDNLASGDTYRGSLVDNDDFGFDGAGDAKVIQGDGFYEFDHGTLRVNQDGTYELILDRSVTYNHNYELNYTIQDKDGDTSSAVLRFYVTPLVLDLDGDGLELTDAQNGVMFDYDIDGELEQTSWVKSDDGFLVQDRNNDGIINDRSEMFGDMFGFSDGFLHLASLDTDEDGFITNKDDQWSDLQVWQDLNQDGVSDQNELLGLDDLGIESINVNDVESVDRAEGESYVSATSSYTTVDGETNEISDVHFDYEDENIDMSLYKIDRADDLMMSVIHDASERQDTVDAFKAVEEVLFMGQDESVDAAIQDYVFSTSETQDVVQDGSEGQVDISTISAVDAMNLPRDEINTDVL